MAKIVLFAIGLLAGSFVDADFTYDRCDQAWGPSAWGGHCKSGNSNSPINLCSAKGFTGPAAVMTTTGYDQAKTVVIKNDGHTVQIDYSSDAPYLNMQQIAAIVGRSVETTDFTWKLGYINLHWGRKDKKDEGSEHYVQGQRYPMEAHLVHYNTARGKDVTSAVASGFSDAVLIVAVFLELANSDIPIISAMAGPVKALAKAPQPLGTPVKASDLLDSSNAYYAYAGSFTTPSCNGVVTWVVMKGRKPITQATLDMFKVALLNPPATPTPVAPVAPTAAKFGTLATADASSTPISLYGNFRPLQAIGVRSLYSSDGPTVACSPVVEPDFKCTNGGLSVTPSLLLQFLVVIAVIVTRH